MDRHRIPLRIGVAALVTGLVGCGPLDLTSAYTDQRPICSDPELFAELIADCRARWDDDRSCAGVLGFEGALEGVDVVVESELDISSFDQVQTLDGPIVRDRIALTGRSPYFEYTLTFKHVGGSIDEPDAPSRQLEVGEGDSILDDDLTEASFRLATGIESDDSTASAGYLISTLQLVDEQIADFRLEFDNGDAIEGCVHALGTELSQSTE